MCFYGVKVIQCRPFIVVAIGDLPVYLLLQPMLIIILVANGDQLMRFGYLLHK